LRRPLETSPRDGPFDCQLKRRLETALGSLAWSLGWSFGRFLGQFLWTVLLRVSRRAFCDSHFDWRPLGGPLDGHSAAGPSTAASLRCPLGGPSDGRSGGPSESPRRPGLLQATLRKGLRGALKKASQVHKRGLAGARPGGSSRALQRGLTSDRAEAVQVALQRPIRRALQGPFKEALQATTQRPCNGVFGSGCSICAKPKGSRVGRATKPVFQGSGSGYGQTRGYTGRPKRANPASPTRGLKSKSEPAPASALNGPSDDPSDDPSDGSFGQFLRGSLDGPSVRVALTAVSRRAPGRSLDCRPLVCAPSTTSPGQSLGQSLGRSLGRALGTGPLKKLASDRAA